MKVAFWSNVSGRSATTSNTAAISVMSTLMCNNSIVLFENHPSVSGLENMLLNTGAHNKVMEGEYTYNNLGIDAILRKINSKADDICSIENNVISFLSNRLKYIPNNSFSNAEFFEYELNMAIKNLMDKLEAFSGNVFIDIAGNSRLSTKTIINEADIVVVNLNQNKSIIDDFFRNYSSLLDKALFIIGNYEQYSRFDTIAITRRYAIPQDKLSVIPYNYEFREALMNGTLINFIEKNYNCKKRDKNYYFISQLKAAVMMLENFMKIQKEGVK